MSGSTADLGEVTDRVLTRIGRWTPRHWATHDRMTTVHAVLQRLADLAAEFDGAPPRAVPNLGGAAVSDQLTVLVGDLADADEATRARAAECLRSLS